MYTTVNFPTKKALREALARGEEVGIWQPGPFGPDGPREGRVYLEGPWYPQPHHWYAAADVLDGKIVKVR